MLSLTGNCGMLPDPDNGMVTHINGTLEGAVAAYTCAPGFDLIGNILRVCGNNTRWFGSPPKCSGKWHQSQPLLNVQ